MYPPFWHRKSFRGYLNVYHLVFNIVYVSSDLHPFTHTPHALKQLRAAISPVMVSVGIYCNALKEALAQYVGPHQTSGVDSQLL